VRGSDHRDHARTECLRLATGLTRQEAFDLEAQLTAIHLLLANMSIRRRHANEQVAPCERASNACKAPLALTIKDQFLARNGKPI